MCRKYGEKLCDSPKCPVTKRSYPPGVHGVSKRRPKVSGYGKQLLEKQKVKRLYGILERQFSNYVAEASKKTGDTGVFVIQYLESRLDNVAYRAGFASSRAAGRQLVGHGHVSVNGQKVNIPSYRVKVGDTVAIYEKSVNKKIVEILKEGLNKVEPPAWIGLDVKALSAKILNNPTLSGQPFNAKSIVEFYSR